MSDDPQLALVLKILWRLIVVTVGFVLAIMAAGFVLAIAITHDLAIALDAGNGTAATHSFFRGFFLVIGFAGIAFVPWAIGTIVAELIQYRSAFYHLGLGALCGAAASIIHPLGEPRALQVSIATGLVAGGVYWIIAGRRAGDWWPRHVQPLFSASPTPGQRPPPPPPPPPAR